MKFILISQQTISNGQMLTVASDTKQICVQIAESNY
jgi:hypothetical protein